MKFFFPRSPRLRDIFLVIFFVFVSFVPSATNVRAAPDPVISIDNTTVEIGGTTVVTVRVNGLLEPGLAGYDFTVYYDPTVVALIGLTGTSEYPDPYPEFVAPETNPSKYSGIISVTSAQPTGTIGNIDLFKLTFQGLSTTAQPSPITLTVNDEGFSDPVLGDIPYTIHAGSIMVEGAQTPSINVSPSILTEANANDGSLASGDIFLTLTNGTFADDISKSDITMTGLPAGMDFLVSSTSSAALKLSITGKALNHENANDTTLTLAVNHTKVSGAIADLTGNIELDFNSNNDATLSNITLPTGVLTPTFDKNVTNYNVILPFGSTEVPQILAAASDPKALIHITQASSTTGSALIVVTANDQVTTQTYEIRFTLSSGKSITGVATNSDINVPNGTSLAAIGLPNSLEVTLDDSSTQNVNVTWDGGNPAYNATIAGTYTFTGIFTNLPTGVTNPNNLTSTVNVFVASGMPSGPSFTLAVGKKLGRGDKVPRVSIPISINQPGVTQYSFDITYDATKILPVEVNGTGITGAVVPLTTTISTSADTGTVHFTWNGTSTTTAGKLFNVVFSVQTAMAKTDPDVTINISNANFTISGIDSNNSTVTTGFIRYGMFGDIDNNGSINNLDIGLARQAYSKTKVLTSNQIMAADVTGEGSINNLDIGALRQKYSGTLVKFKVE